MQRLGVRDLDQVFTVIVRFGEHDEELEGVLLEVIVPELQVLKH